MGRIKFLYLIIIIIVGCNNPTKENRAQDFLILESAMYSSDDLIGYYKRVLLEETASNSSEASRIKNIKIKSIINIDHTSKIKFYELIEHRNIDNYDKVELINRLTYFKKGISLNLTEKEILLFDKFLAERGYFEGIEDNYKNNKELKYVLMKKFLFIRLATIEAITLIYN